jgi:hypothetical protein
MIFRFLGSESSIGDDIELKTFAQSIELSDELAKLAILGGCALLDETAFDQIGFDKADLEKFYSVGEHARAPAEFLEKKKAALIAAHDLRERLENGGSLVVAQPEQE